METKHTPGPWQARPGHPTLVEGPPRDKFAPLVICNVGGTKPQDHANARLIAAAPDLLEALAALAGLARSTVRPSGHPDVCHALLDIEGIARAAITKAEGRG